jgi:hypothetical protein
MSNTKIFDTLEEYEAYNNEIVHINEIITAHVNVTTKLGIHNVRPDYDNRNLHLNPGIKYIHFFKGVFMTRKQLKDCTNIFEDYLGAAYFLRNIKSTPVVNQNRQAPPCVFYKTEEIALEKAYSPYAQIIGFGTSSWDSSW